MTAIQEQIIQVLNQHGPLTANGLRPYVSGTATEIVKAVLALKLKGLICHFDKVSVPARWIPTPQEKQ